MTVIAVPMIITRSEAKRFKIVKEIRRAVAEARRLHPGLGALVDITVKRLEGGVRLVLYFSSGPRTLHSDDKRKVPST